MHLKSSEAGSNSSLPPIPDPAPRRDTGRAGGPAAGVGLVARMAISAVKVVSWVHGSVLSEQRSVDTEQQNDKRHRHYESTTSIRKITEHNVKTQRTKEDK